MTRKSKPIHFELIVQNLILIFGLSLVFIIVSYSTLRHQGISELSGNLRNSVNLIDYNCRESLLLKDYESVRQTVAAISEKIPFRITIIQENGTVIADNQSDYRVLENHLHRVEIQNAIKDGVGKSIRYSDTVHSNLIYLGIPVFNESSIIGFIRVSSPVSEVTRNIYSMMKKIIFIDIIFFLITVFVSHTMLIRFTAPLDAISLASKKVAAGDFSVRLFNPGDSEISELIKNFNYMSSRLDDLFSQVISEKEQAQSIFSSVNEGIMLLGVDGLIKEVNKSFNTISGSTIQLKGRYYWEVLRNRDLISLIKKSSESKKNLVEEIGYGGKSFICSCNFITSKNEKVLIISDMTKLKNLENLKKDFVANVSHELRTPLTAIKGFIETLLDDKTEADDDFSYLQIIARHTDRMINIVNDLLILSEVEKKDSGVTFESVDLMKIAETIGVMFTEKLKNKSLVFKVIGSGSFIVKADAYRIEQLFINLIDNAIKYTDSGSITVSFIQDGNSVIINCIDTGIGINLSVIDTDRLFERFFVVDSSRSRKTGGTGLGLSIVKHIVLLHGGEIKLKSLPGVGTTVSVILPLNM
ncbi:MAG: hypothetical protein A2015_14570 [Spirochaetes bacterium GWF1_31_7]|nr:MAG: hypothetical protein A2Y30_03185 [Spirochaetes bacterium GWE1_32_154]OHD47864.1 MAG: hypothetical protein A2Y29_17710 [Spirochaetes bacterium GWE2_31_10]OHD50621.1 MAG: hypothetical protein A2015_14570 [Spirochaetes bacterium GWF1_31_7]HBD92713.1 hypothetical protein [Spirochaetia bacterium]HBI36496.1 hypothetical protein [Spirochaetia bacterium]